MTYYTQREIELFELRQEQRVLLGAVDKQVRDAVVVRGKLPDFYEPAVAELLLRHRASKALTAEAREKLERIVSTDVRNALTAALAAVAAEDRITDAKAALEEEWKASNTVSIGAWPDFSTATFVICATLADCFAGLQEAASRGDAE